MNIIKTVDEFTGILAVPAFSEVDELNDTEDSAPNYYFMAIYADRKFLDTLKFIRLFAETVPNETDPVTIGNIEFYPKKESFPILLFEGKLEYNKYPFSLSGFKPKNILDPASIKNGHLQWINSNSLVDSIFIVYDSEGGYLRFSCDDCDGIVYNSFDIKLEYLISYIEENLKDGIEQSK